MIGISWRRCTTGLVVLGASVIFAADTPTQHYVDTGGHFEISYPKNWELIHPKDYGGAAFSTSDASFEVLTPPCPDPSCALPIPLMRNLAPGYTPFQTHVNGMPAAAMKGTHGSTGRPTVEIHISTGSLHYVITYQATQEKFSRYQPIFDDILASFRMMDSPQRIDRSAGRDSLNAVAAYLDHAELQMETLRQRAEIRRALRDMLAEVPGDSGWLKHQRYADFEGEEGQWSSVTLLRKYFVPSSRIRLDDQTFYRAVGQADAKAAIRRWIDHLRSTNSVLQVSCPDRVRISQTVSKVRGWRIMPGPDEQSAEGITLFDGHPSNLAALKPENGDEISDFYYWMGLDTKGHYWLTCNYPGGAALAQPLPAGFNYCESSLVDGSQQVACFVGP